MAYFRGSAANETVRPGFVSSTVYRLTLGSSPSDASDVLDGGAGNDTLIGGGGNDFLIGGTGADIMDGGFGDDTYYVDNVLDVAAEVAGGIDTVESTVSYSLSANLENLNLHGSAYLGVGNARANVINGNTVDNWLNGGAGNDSLYGYSGNDTLFGGTGADRMVGGPGDDTYFVDDIFDITDESASLGRDTVNSSVTYRMSTGIDMLRLTGSSDIHGFGNFLDNVMWGNAGNNALYGRDGADILIGGASSDTLGGDAGADNLQGDGGDDYLTGGAGTDLLTGGFGSDRFEFLLVSDSLPGAGIRDTITDFAGNGTELGDIIDLSAIDANDLLPGNQAFTWIAGNAFTAAAQLRYADGLLQANTGQNLAADFEIRLTSAPPLSVGGLGTDIFL